MTTRSTVSADISEHTIWINSTDFKSSVKAVKIHELLIKDFGYSDGSMLEEGRRGKGFSISVFDERETVKQMREDYACAKKLELTETTTPEHKRLAQEYLDNLYE